MTTRRPYELKKRATRQRETHDRIAAATAALHSEVGPARTTISAVAERAGVERLTVYRHFPTERELLAACQEHFLAAHPVPDLAAWRAIADPVTRLRVALGELFARNDATEGMTVNVLRDSAVLPELAAQLEGLRNYERAAVAVLAAGWPVPAGQARCFDALLGHTIAFETWRSLVRRQGLTNEDAVELLTRMICCVAPTDDAHEGGAAAEKGTERE